MDTTSYVLAALTASGGVIGYARTGSVPSIVAGCAVGLLYGYGGYRVQHGQSLGLESSVLASVILGGASLPRAIRQRKPVPAMLSVISLYGLAVFGNALLNRTA